MPERLHSAEEMITRLREAEVVQSKGQTLLQSCKALGISEQTDYRRRKEHGGLFVLQRGRRTLTREPGRSNCPETAVTP
jgi:hypothetical protein